MTGRPERAQGVTVHHERIDQYRYSKKCSGGDLSRFLRCRMGRPKRYGTQSRHNIIPNQVSLDDRPSSMNAKQRLGDREGRTVIGKNHRGVLVTLVDRETLFTVIQKVCRKMAELVRNAVRQGL